MKNFLLISIVVLVALFLRFFSISTNPPSLTWDEASWGYNAYSLGKDGHDEFGKFLPITYLESFGDFKPPVYAYLSVLPVKAFGLNEFSTRFTSAFFGVLTVVLTFFLVRKIFHKGSFVIALFASALLTISPWHILLSRAAFEANVATFFIVLGVYLFLESKTRKWLLPLSVVSFVVSMYTFNTARVVSPLLLLILVFMNRSHLLKSVRIQFVTSIILGGIIFIPLFLFLLTPQAKLRYQEVNIFSDAAIVERANQEIANDNGALWSKIIHNRRLGYGVEYIKHYFDNFSPDFLFIRGDGNPKFSIRDVGQLYVFEIPFLIAGILYLFKKKEGEWWLIPAWILIGIIPAATARETPHALRIETTIPMFQILTAYGLYNVFLAILKVKMFKIRIFYPFVVMLCFMVVFSFIYFMHNYFINYPREFSSEWQYGYKEAIKFTSDIEPKFDNVIFTEELGRPYIYVLFYKQYDPPLFRKEAKIDRETLGFVHVRSFGKYKFVESVLDNLDQTKNNLYVDTRPNVPGGAKILKIFNLLNGEPSLVAYTL